MDCSVKDNTVFASSNNKEYLTAVFKY